MSPSHFFRPPPLFLFQLGCVGGGTLLFSFLSASGMFENFPQVTLPIPPVPLCVLLPKTDQLFWFLLDVFFPLRRFFLPNSFRPKTLLMDCFLIPPFWFNGSLC